MTGDAGIEWQFLPPADIAPHQFIQLQKQVGVRHDGADRGCVQQTFRQYAQQRGAGDRWRFKRPFPPYHRFKGRGDFHVAARIQPLPAHDVDRQQGVQVRHLFFGEAFVDHEQQVVGHRVIRQTHGDTVAEPVARRDVAVGLPHRPRIGTQERPERVHLGDTEPLDRATGRQRRPQRLRRGGPAGAELQPAEGG